MILYLFKPFGGDNYLALSKPDEIQKFFSALTPGDEFVMTVLELSDQEYDSLDDFGGFEGNAAPPSTGTGSAAEEGSPEEEATEPPDKEAAEDSTAQG